jgi:hypothetical protein
MRWQLSVQIYRRAVCRIWSGGDALIEHPAMPVWVERSAPLWFLPQLRLLRRRPAAEHFEFEQCERRQVGCKPACVMALRTGSIGGLLRDTLGRGRYSHPEGFRKRLRGRDVPGKFEIFVAEIYPESMRACIGQAFANAVAECCSSLHHAPNLDDEFRPFLAKSDVQSGAAPSADFAS